MTAKNDRDLDQNMDEQAAIFSALADPTRLKLVKLLCHQQEPNALCVNALACLLGVTQSAVSQHLKVLRSIGLVKGTRRGNQIHYFIYHHVLERYRALILDTLTFGEVEQQKSFKEYCAEMCKKDVS